MEIKAAILGATSQLGRLVAQQLLEQSIQVRILTRNQLKARKMFGSRVEIMEGDLTEVRDLKKFVQGITHLLAVYDTKCLLADRTYELIDFGGIDKALDSMEKQDIHIVYLSCLDVEHEEPLKDAVNRYYWKRLTEQMLKISGHPYTVIRTDVYTGQNMQTYESLAWKGLAYLMVKAVHDTSYIGKTFEVSNTDCMALGSEPYAVKSKFREVSEKQLYRKQYE